MVSSGIWELGDTKFHACRFDQLPTVIDGFNWIAFAFDRLRIGCVHQSNLVVMEKSVEVQFTLPRWERDGLSVEGLQEFEPRYI